MVERLTIIDFVEKYVGKYSANPFLWEKNLDSGQWEPTSYEETLRQAKRIAAGLMSLGVQKGEKVSYLSEGRNMWVIGELGVLYAGAVNVPLSIKLGEAKDLVFRINHSESKYVITSKFQLPMIRAVLPECPMVEKVIVFDQIDNRLENVITEFVKLTNKFNSFFELIHLPIFKVLTHVCRATGITTYFSGWSRVINASIRSASTATIIAGLFDALIITLATFCAVGFVAGRF